LLHRKDFEIKRICRKLLVDQKIGFVVSWKSTWVPVKLIVKGNSVEYPYVDADGTRWNIKETFRRRKKNGIEEVKVRWMKTKEPVEMLSNAQEAIDAFEADLRLGGADEIAQVRQRRILTISESRFPRSSVLPQSEEDYAESQRWVSSLWPELRPHKTLDLYPAFYRIHMELANRRRNKRHGGKSYRCLMKLPQVRPLRWSQEFLDSGASLNCPRKRASIFVQATGVQIVRHCTRCSNHRLAPFIECVRTALDQQRWFNGACANCGTQRNTSCDYHEVFVGRAGVSSLRKFSRRREFCGRVLILPLAARSANDSHSTIVAPQQERTERTTVDRRDDDDNSGDTSDDTSDDDDDDDDDDFDDDDDDDGNDAGNDIVSAVRRREAGNEAGASGTRILPPLPPNLPAKDFMFNGALAATGSAGGSTPASSQNFGGLSLSSPIPSKRRGKLPSATKTIERLSRTSIGQASSLAALHRRVRARHEDNENRSRQDIDVGETSRVQWELSASQQTAGENYTPQPIELDLLKLAFKYDHLEPLKHRTPKTAALVSTSAAVNQEPGHTSTVVDQTPQQMSAQNKRTLHFSLDLASPVSKKRPASMPPLHRRRPPQRQAFMEPGNPASPTSVLPSTAPTAPQNLVGPTNTEPARRISAKTFLQIRTLAEIERDDVHTGCQEGQPCRDYLHAAPVPRDPDARVYRGMLRKGRPISLEEAEQIVLQANCFWARRFTVLWTRWCEEVGGIENEERSQVEWLLSFPESLRKAAEECCPKRPRVLHFPRRLEDVVPIDD
jgi:hypothetical protein